MLYHDRFGASEGIDVNKSSKPKEFMLHHYCCFLDNGYRYEPEAFNGFRDVSMMAYEFNHITILFIKDVDY